MKNKRCQRIRINGKCCYTHRLIAEKALGKPLPPKAVVHHHTDTQLVVCEDQSYHMLLHKRMWGFKNKKKIIRFMKIVLDK